MKKGERVGPEVEIMVCEWARDCPSWSQERIASEVFERYHVKIHRSTVALVLSRKGIRRSVPRTAPPGSSGEDRSDGNIKDHRDMLMAVLLDLRGIEPMAVHHYDLAVFYSLPHESSWPIPKSRVWREKDDKLIVRLNIEARLEMTYLQQHLEGDPVWKTILACKAAMATDLQARMALLDGVIGRIQRPKGEGGGGLPFQIDIGPLAGTGTAVSLVYGFAIYNQVLSRSLGLQHGALSQRAFTRSWMADTLELARGPAITSPDPKAREQAVKFLLYAQGKWVSLPQAAEAARAYRQAEKATGVVKSHLERLRLAIAFPPGSTCDACRPWISSIGKDIP